MNTNQQIPATQNEAWGFWGTMNEHASAAWPLAMTAISDATSQPLESVRLFLDSRHGRHFAPRDVAFSAADLWRGGAHPLACLAVVAEKSPVLAQARTPS